MTEKGHHSISVVIPAYNTERHIRDAIESVLSQSFPAKEIIVVDDGSTDRTGEIVKGYGDKVRYIYQENTGPSAARNSGIRAATGEWIGFLDSDDKWNDNKLSRQSWLLDRNEELCWCACNYEIKRKDEPGVAILDQDQIGSLLADSESMDVFDAMLAGNNFLPSCMLVRRDIFEKTGFFDENLRYAEDIDMWWRIGYISAQVGFVNELLVSYSAGHAGSAVVEMPIGEKLDFLGILSCRHMELAGEHGRGEQFRRFMQHRLKKWIYAAYQRKKFDIVRQTILRSRNVLPTGYRSLMNFLTILPKRSSRIGKIVIALLKMNR